MMISKIGRGAVVAAALGGACTAGPGDDASASAASTSGDAGTSGDASASSTSVGATTTTTTTSTTTSTTSTSTGAAESESEGDTDGPPVRCAATPMEHAEACPGDPCPIVADVEIRCDDDEVGAPGLRVAATAADAWLVSASSNARIFFRVDGDGGEAVDVLPAEFDRETVLLAAGPDGALHAMADLTQPPTYAGGLTHVGDQDGWAPSLVFDAPKYVPVLDLEVAQDGTPHLWFIGDAPDQLNLATRAGQGPWEVVLAPAPAGVDWTHYTLTSAGAPASAGLREGGPGWQLWTLIGGVEAALGGPVADFFPYAYRLTPAPVPVAPPGPPLAAAIQHADGVRVTWPEGQVYNEALIPGTELLATTCDDTWDQGCPGPCHELGEGLEEGALALARTGDGDAWLVHVRTHLDLSLTYTEVCDPEFGCACQGEVMSDASYGVLHLVRVPLGGGPPAPALAQPMARPALWDLFSGWEDTPRAIDARAFGDHLAVAVRGAEAPVGPHALRVLRIDTSLVAP